MADNTQNTNDRITSKQPLVDYIQVGCKPQSNWRIGTEHEKFPYHLKNFSPLTYDEENGIRKILEGLQRFGWEPVFEENNVIALKQGAGAISLEPAGQLELSGAPLANIHQTCDEVSGHLQQVKIIAAEMGIGFIGLGYRPDGKTEDMPWMPKGRYKIMREYMPKVGTMGLEMMQSTCTVQVNLDFDSEQTMVEMFRISLALQPVATAIWANSPFKNGKPNGFLSYRSHIWTDTDNDRCGTIPFVFEDGFGFERYVDYILDVPMYFVYRNGVYIDASGQSFRDFMIGKLPALPGELPTIKDWEDQMSVAFPEVRLKQFLEMRGTDGGSWASLCALPAFWVGLLYDNDARRAAYDLIKNWTPEEHARLRTEVPTAALKTKFRDQTLREVALQVLEISHAGLKSRHALDSVGLDETHYLKPLFKIAETGQTQAEELLCAYERQWKKSVIPVYSQYSY
jgi:glutamate--cysteine ligase